MEEWDGCASGEEAAVNWADAEAHEAERIDGDLDVDRRLAPECRRAFTAARKLGCGARPNAAPRGLWRQEGSQDA